MYQRMKEEGKEEAVMSCVNETFWCPEDAAAFRLVCYHSVIIDGVSYHDICVRGFLGVHLVPPL